MPVLSSTRSIARRAGLRRYDRQAMMERLPRRRTRLLGGLAGGAVLAVFGAEAARIWRLGTLPLGRDELGELGETTSWSPRRTLTIVREGYRVSTTRENALFNLLASFILSFATTRSITWVIRERGGFGPIKNVTVGERHIHHFIPGGLISFLSGGLAIGSKSKDVDKWLAIPFGIGVALVLDESALLLELEDVYWTEEGVLSVQIAFAAIAMLAAIAYAIQVLRRGKGEHHSEADWEIAARAWDDLAGIGGSGEPRAEPGASFGIG